jgi:nucleotide-binding universal stress UspA family protein
VIGSYGAGRAELLLGSVSLECVEQASGPVLIYRQP